MKQGTRVKIGQKNGVDVNFTGVFGTVDKPSGKTDRGWCYDVKLDNGHNRSYLVDYLIEVVEVPVDQVAKPPVERITFAQVKEAQENVDKAQRAFVELLSRYQLQEAGK